MYTTWNKIREDKDAELTELEESVAQDVVVVSTRRILRPPKKGSAVKRPRTRTLTAVHDAMLEDVGYPAEIVGECVRYGIDGSKIMKVLPGSQGEKQQAVQAGNVIWSLPKA